MRTVEEEKKHQAMLAGMTGLVLMLNASLHELDPKERIELFKQLLEGHCRACGEEGLPCYCQNDE